MAVQPVLPILGLVNIHLLGIGNEQLDPGGIARDRGDGSQLWQLELLAGTAQLGDHDFSFLPCRRHARVFTGVATVSSIEELMRGVDFVG